ncbi:hypothetical protein H2200_000929 [Cladophialophora chaetospira]|uniref:Velvet domain-containing protein n=1 Tax=Cladophialophora chaetospira TaxID=386627 RepID=A0AA38XPF4_9EURO|nr:hypothetical protein H2200_000929 [Cladophialophora chaetospira]
MAQLPSLAEMSLTRDMDRPQDPAPQQPAIPPPARESRESLPSLKDTLGEEYNAKRPLAPHPTAPPPPELPGLYVPGQSELYLDGQVIRTYRIAKLYYNMQQPPHETKNEFSRITLDQRRLTYTLEVVQQPEKARACGSGNKSSNDRRPVDPPPVVELRIYCNGVETTMTYDATFMLYASLELARPIAHGRQHTPTTIPVLAGVTVASAAYLEKPRRAAYFIFPDLSVRHEGLYRIRFSLFEGVKHHQDADIGKPFDLTHRETDNLSAPVRHEGVFNRMDVLSTPFQVFSAKKFPGLDQSTDLSVLVADQGCRVRIRRDVRQRKRRAKSGAEGDDAQSSTHGTPQAAYRTLDHSRSASRNSVGSQYDRRESFDSYYGRPTYPSRQMSASSLPMASPVLPTPTSSMPPPPPYLHHTLHRDNVPRPALPATASQFGQPPMSLPSPSTLQGVTSPGGRGSPYNNILPPIQTTINGDMRSGPSTPRYKTPPSTATKRSFSSTAYSQQMALKSGLRPDSFPAYPPAPPPGANDIIEADPDCCEDDDEETQRLIHGDLAFLTADGNRRTVTGSVYRRSFRP